MVVQPCEYTKNHWTVDFKNVNFIACELYLNFLSGRHYKVIKKRWRHYACLCVFGSHIGEVDAEDGEILNRLGWLRRRHK